MSVIVKRGEIESVELDEADVTVRVTQYSGGLIQLVVVAAGGCSGRLLGHGDLETFCRAGLELAQQVRDGGKE